MAVAVVAGPLLRVAQDVVSLGRLLEPLLGLGVAEVAVGVVLHGQLAVRLRDRVVVRVRVDAEDFVEVTLRRPSVNSSQWRPVEPRDTEDTEQQTSERSSPSFYCLIRVRLCHPWLRSALTGSPRRPYSSARRRRSW